MVPFADYINHENVETGFDCHDQFGMSFDGYKDALKDKEETAREKWRENRQ